MSDQTDVFAGQAVPTATQAPTTGQAAPQPNTTDYSDLLGSIRNEAGNPKYETLPEALKGLAHAQQYIPELKTKLSQQEQEIVNLRAELAKRTEVEEIVSRLTATQSQPQGQGQPPAASGLDEEAVMNLVRQTLASASAADTAKANTAKVQQALTSKFGEKSREVVEAKAKELGMAPQELGQLASKNPSLVLALFNAPAVPGARPTTGSVNIPPYNQERAALERPSKSLLSGATSKEQAAYMQRVKEEVYAKYNIQQ